MGLAKGEASWQSRPMATQPTLNPGLQTAAIALLAAVQVIGAGVFCLLAYIDANLVRGGWSWAADGWTVGVATLFCAASILSLLAIIRGRVRLAWGLTLAAMAVGGLGLALA
jgi:hypothetical protein